MVSAGISAPAAALSCRDLQVRLPGGATVVGGVDLDLHRGRVLAVVGRSGAGKSLTVAALARMLPDGLRASGSVELAGPGLPAPVDLLALPERRLRALRGSHLAWLGQDATASLNPTVSVGRHLSETLRAHQPRRGRGRRSRVRLRDEGLAALADVGLPDPAALWDAHPFELSGGQAQRVAIALATALDPAVLLADEVTSALDVVSQGEVMALLRAQADAGRAVLLVTHDLAAAERWADHVVVLDAGRVVERGSVESLVAAPATELTRAWVEVAAGEGAGVTGVAPPPDHTLAPVPS